MPYHLVVTGDSNAFSSGQFEIAVDRCLTFTETRFQEYFFRFAETRIDELLAFPALVAREAGVDAQVQLVRLTEIVRRRDRVRARFEPIGTQLLTYDQFRSHAFELDIDDFEYHRTHWAFKNVDLAEVLARAGISTSLATFLQRPYVNLETHAFRVALSFPGEDRNLVQDIASRLEQRLGPNTCFYDLHYQAFLARPSLDTLLQTIYRNAQLNVVFLSENYERKRWCSGIEFRVIREIIANREHDRVMFVRTGGGDVTGVFNTDGWIDSNRHSADDIAFFVEQRSRVYDS